eukprot:Nitzschia sp. Nitz4//scaffold111_size72815//56756//60609//NITZ4_005798-RA/size72815-snap-gene-0.111-mRNA-1//-1//CDS//3329533204//2729//frame0
MATDLERISLDLSSEYLADSQLSKQQGDFSSASKSSNDGSRSNDQHSPESLVRQENKQVRVIRAMVVLVLLIASILTSYFVYHVTRDSQEASFEDAFIIIASKLTTVMVSDLSLKFWMANSLSETVSTMLELSDERVSSFMMDQGQWEKLTKGARVRANANMVSWNPLLNTDKERQEFEDLAGGQQLLIGTEPECLLCGMEDRGFSNPEDFVDLTGFGIYTCGALENGGRRGVFPLLVCALAVQTVQEVCHCVDLPAGSNVVENNIESPQELFMVNETSQEVVAVPYSQPPYLAAWSTSVLEAVNPPYMFDHLSDSRWNEDVAQMMQSNLPVLSRTFYRTGSYFEEYAGHDGETGTVLHYPVFQNDTTVGSISFDIRWATFVSSEFPPASHHVDVVVENTCGQNFTYGVNEEIDQLVLKGEGDLHDKAYSHKYYSSLYESFDGVVFASSNMLPQTGSSLQYCRYRFHVFGSQGLKNEYVNSEPVIFAVVTASVFLFTSIVFLVYDVVVARRQRKVMESANKTSAIVSSLFPRNVRDRLLDDAQRKKTLPTSGSVGMSSRLRVHSVLRAENNHPIESSKPIADLFPSATVMFLDIVGFTAWSSEREPTQVFQLLESVYHEFDNLAKKLGVFKVETIGDSYVAVCGLPSKRHDHAVVMAKFAERCLHNLSRVTRKLEVTLGPSTGDLGARVGLHSGPVTAGVLRGDKARFQLFGDTVNTAARLENSGKPGQIHASQSTVNLLLEAGKSQWVRTREEKVSLKGKGDLQTFWVAPHSMLSDSRSTTSSGSDVSSLTELQPNAGTVKRFIDWNVEVIYLHLEKLATYRRHLKDTRSFSCTSELVQMEETIVQGKDNGTLVVDEISEQLTLAEFNPAACHIRENSNSTLDPKVKEQLQEYVFEIARLYRQVPFHNFEHVSHVVMSASKLMNRIIYPDNIDYSGDPVEVAKEIHELTFGVSSDPLLQFSVVFASLIHDVDHTGLTNTELNAMETVHTTQYRQQSVAEQNSVDVAWMLLMEHRFRELRGAIYTNEKELRQFRQIIVNTVIATDIADKKLKHYREGRWEMAFPKHGRRSEASADDGTRSDAGSVSLTSTAEDVNRKAAIVVEYIIQASDVAHTMQHWHTYQKFNRRLFEERYVAWLEGHAEKDPSVGWYGGELWFFDNYIIPLANKLDECGVFGVSYDEYVTYAMGNRKEWELKGERIVSEMKASCETKYAKRLAAKTEATSSTMESTTTSH